MSDLNSTPNSVPVTPVIWWDGDLVFSMAGDPLRRRLLLILAKGGAKTGFELKSNVGRQLGTALKQLAILCKAGMVIKLPNPKDGRQPLYQLAPNITVINTAKGPEIDFGSGVVRA